jgi:hypothetical protein
VVKLRPALASDVIALYGEPLHTTVLGITGVEGDRVLGMGAIYPSDGCMVMICRIAPDARCELQRHAKTMVRGARRLIAIAGKTKLPLRTVADRRFPRAVELIEHLGFRHLEKDIYEWATPA